MLSKNTITKLLQNKRLSAIDVHFATFISNCSRDHDEDLFLAAGLVSRATSQGDICLDLESVAGLTLLDDPTDATRSVVCPQLKDWLRKLKGSPAVGSPGQIRPLVLDSHHRLYLYRYWEYEQIISQSIKRRIQTPSQDVDVDHFKKALNRLFPHCAHQEVDWQKIAAAAACLRHFCVITGGPGTGKTFTVTKVLAMLLELTTHQRLNIYLAAPTGKAAARLADILELTRKQLDSDSHIMSAFPTEVFTIHRMLKPIEGSPYFRYNAENPLPADVVVVDEASMVDLALMAKLLQAIPDSAQLILVGDKDQLASVEAGSVLGDICDRDVMHGFSPAFKKRIKHLTGENLEQYVSDADTAKGLQDSVVVLHKSYRFEIGSGIGALSRSINDGDVERALQTLKNRADSALIWRELNSDAHVLEELAEQIVSAYRPCLAARDPAEALRCLEAFKILCAVNIGPLGVQAVNRLAEQVLSRHHLIQPNPNVENPWYAGRPVLITRNSYPLGLFNGDIGITLPPDGAERTKLVVYFRSHDGSIRRFLPHQLPEHQTVYAMTVHKSQGSEFDSVLLILPGKDVPLLTRELVYTALTRARKNITIWGRSEILRKALNRSIRRTSGLRDALWGFRKQKSEDGRQRSDKK